MLQDSSLQKYLPMAAQTLQKQKRALGEDGQSKTKGWFADKIKKAVAKSVARMGNFILNKAGSYIVLRLMRMSAAKYRCLCGGYLGQLFSYHRKWVVAPGFHWNPADQKWRTKDPGPILFSILQVQKSAVEKRTQTPMADGNKTPDVSSPVCQYDASFNFQYCFKSSQFKTTCAMKGCTAINKNACSCSAAAEALYAKRLQCKPDRNTCGGSTVSKLIKFELVKGDAKYCRPPLSNLISLHYD
jgi:hypothetical protein